MRRSGIRSLSAALVACVMLVLATMTGACSAARKAASGGTETPAAPPDASETQAANWPRAVGRDVSLRLPSTFVAADLNNDLSVIIDRLQHGGGNLAPLADVLRQNPDLIRLLAVSQPADASSQPVSVVVTTEQVLSTTTIDAYTAQSTGAFERVFGTTSAGPATKFDFDAYQARRIVEQFTAPAHAAAPAPDAITFFIYILKLGNTMWVVELVTPRAEGPANEAMMDAAIKTFRSEFVRVSTPQPAVASSQCGTGATVSLVGDSPLANTDHGGAELDLHFTYHAPGCTQVSAFSSGFHVAGSGWYQYWCVDHKGNTFITCLPDRVDSFVSFTVSRLDASDGDIKLFAVAGGFPPVGLGAAPPLAGYAACRIQLNFGDDTFGGSNVEFDLGKAC